MENIAKIKELLQKAVDIVYKAEKYEEHAFVLAQKIGLQGEKRRLRYESVKSHNLINYLISDSYDALGVNLTRTHHNVSVPENSSIKSFFEMYLGKLEDQYEALHEVANALVVNNYQHGACRLYELCKCLIDDMKYYRRTINEGNATGWSVEFIYLHQTTEENVHDHFEEKEKSIGYS